MNAVDGTARLARPSQALWDLGTLTGGLAAACSRSPGCAVTLRYRAGEPHPRRHVAGAACARATAPTCSWEAGGASGPLAAMGFVAAWNMRLTVHDGHPLSYDVEGGDGFDLPFVALHPSGAFQAVRFDRSRGMFVRRVLYPVASAEAVAVLAAHADAGTGGWEGPAPRT